MGERITICASAQGHMGIEQRVEGRATGAASHVSAIRFSSSSDSAIFQGLALSEDDGVGNLEPVRNRKLRDEFVPTKRLMNGNMGLPQHLNDAQTLKFSVETKLQQKDKRLFEADSAPLLSLALIAHE